MKRKITLCILLILIIMCVTLLSYEKINKENINNDNGMFAIYLEEEKDSGKYQKSNLKTWPTEEEYNINMLKSYCENGSILRWNNETKKISLKVNGTDKCYVYFDKAEIGSEKHPHLIQTIEDLVRLSNDVNGGKTYAGEYFLLTNDLDFNDPSDYEDANRLDFEDINGINGAEPLIKELTTGTGFKPIGFGLKTDNINFGGTFDGQNHTISNIYISNKTETASVGLFGVIKNATISNLKLGGEIKTEVNANTGTISGRSYGNILIDNIENHVNVTGFSNSGSNGGILGSTNVNVDDNNTNVTLKNCKNYGNISYGNQSAGLIAWVQGTVTIENCHNYGNITLSNGLRAGGLVGAGEAAEVNKFLDKLVIKESSNSGTVYSASLVNSPNQGSGGLIGIAAGFSNTANHINKFIILNSYNIGEIVGNHAGGIIGMNNNNSSNPAGIYIYNSTNLGTVTGGDSSACGILGYTNGGMITIQNVYNAGQLKSTPNAGITYFYQSGSNASIENAYYPSDQVESNINEVYGKYTYEEMKSQSFIDVMNSYVQNNPNVTILDKEYQLLKWEINALDYPIPTK